MDSLDYKKTLKQFYLPSKKEIHTVDVPAMNFLMIDGHGDPNTSKDYQDACNVLYSVSYTLKFSLKKDGVEYSVAPLEGLWWVENMAEFSTQRKEDWDWTMMIMQPEVITAEKVAWAKQEAARKKDLPQLPNLRFERYHEGLSAQVMYYGSYANEGPTVAAIHAFIHENGYVTSGKHHEIYLGDPRKSAPEKLRTVIRQPVRAA